MRLDNPKRALHPEQNAGHRGWRREAAVVCLEIGLLSIAGQVPLLLSSDGGGDAQVSFSVRSLGGQR